MFRLIYNWFHRATTPELSAKTSAAEDDPCSNDINIVQRQIQHALEAALSVKPPRRRPRLSTAGLIAYDYLDDPAMLHRLADALVSRRVDDEDVMFRRAVVHMMGHLRGICFIETLREVLYHDESHFVYLHAADALGDIGLPALEILLQAIIDLPSYRRTKAILAVEHIAYRNPSVLLASLNHPNPRFRWTITRILRDKGNETCLPQLESVAQYDKGVTDLDTVANMAQQAVTRIREDLLRRQNT
jgi:hypothetical protein